MVGRKGSQIRRKSESAKSKAAGHTPNRSEGGRRHELKDDPKGEISERRDWLKNGTKGYKCAMFRYMAEKPCLRIAFLSLAVGLEKFDTWPLSGVLDKKIWILKKSHMPEDREAWGLAGGL